jgi:hypothetical protein
MAITVADLRAQLDHYPDDMLIFACDGGTVHDVHGLETAADILRWGQEHGRPKDVQEHLVEMLSHKEVYLSVVAFA